MNAEMPYSPHRRESLQQKMKRMFWTLRSLGKSLAPAKEIPSMDQLKERMKLRGSKIIVKVGDNQWKVLYVLLMIFIVLSPPYAYLRGLPELIILLFMFLLIIACFIYVLSGRRRETLRRSFDLLLCGLMEPASTFIVVFLVGLGVMFVAKGVDDKLKLGFLERVVMFVDGRPLTYGTILLFALTLLSSIFATWRASKTSRCYHDFVKLISDVAVYVVYILIINALGFVLIGSSVLESRQLPELLTVLGFSTLVLWLYVWTSMCLEEWHQTRTTNSRNKD